MGEKAMRFQKHFVLWAAILLAALVFAACSPQPAATSPAQQAGGWKITVEGAAKAEFTNADYDALGKVTIDVVQKKKDGSETSQKWEGALLKDVVAALGVADYTSLTLTASDDYTKDYTPDIVNDANTIIGTVCNGEALGSDGGWVEAVAGGQRSNMWIKDLIKITVNK
jgi:hypothetical protein